MSGTRADIEWFGQENALASATQILCDLLLSSDCVYICDVKAPCWINNNCWSLSQLMLVVDWDAYVYRCRLWVYLVMYTTMKMRNHIEL